VRYVSTSAPVVQRMDDGSMRFRYSLLCVTDDCLPGKRPSVVRLAAVEVTGLADGRAVKADARWPTLRVGSPPPPVRCLRADPVPHARRPALPRVPRPTRTAR